MKKILTLLLSALPFITSSPVLAGDMRIIVPFTAGGAVDVVARKYAAYVEKTSGGNVFVENVTGAGSTLGTRQLLNSKGDVAMVSTSSFYVNIVKKTFSDDEFRAVSIIAESPMFLATPTQKNLTCNNLKLDQKSFFIGDAGKDSITSVPTSFVISKFKNYTEIPYKGVASALVDLVAGRLDVVFLASVLDRPDIKILANTGSKTYEGYPSIKECLGITQYSDSQFVLVTNKSASAEFIKKANELAIKFVKDPDTKVFFKERGLNAIASDIESTNKEYTYQLTTWSEILK